MAYTTWEYYNSHFPKVNEADFTLYNQQATIKIDVFTHYRAQSATGAVLLRLADCACNLINAIAQQTETNAGAGISSVSNDGYSESYANIKKVDASAELKSVCLEWLSGTGLMGAIAVGTFY